MWLDLIEHHRRLDSDFPPVAGLLESLRREIDRGVRASSCMLLVGEDGDRLVGFLFAEVEGGGERDDLSSRDAAWIHELYVEPGSRDSGLGGSLLERADRWFEEREVPRVRVRVEVRNTAGLRFWRRCGFDDQARILERRF